MAKILNFDTDLRKKLIFRDTSTCGRVVRGCIKSKKIWNHRKWDLYCRKLPWYTILGHSDNCWWWWSHVSHHLHISTENVRRGGGNLYYNIYAVYAKNTPQIPPNTWKLVKMNCLIWYRRLMVRTTNPLIWHSMIFLGVALC